VLACDRAGSEEDFFVSAIVFAGILIVEYEKSVYGCPVLVCGVVMKSCMLFVVMMKRRKHDNCK
jgi:hypothetical protein